MITGEVKEIALKGLSSTGNDYECDDGELQVCHNAVNTGNGLRPIQDVETVKTLPSGWAGIVFRHHTSAGDLNIVIDGDNDAYFYKDEDDTPVKITEPAAGLFQDGCYQLTSVGNVLIINFKYGTGTEEARYNGLHYYRWKEEDGVYKYMGQAPPDIRLEFAAIHYSGTVENDNIYYGDSYTVWQSGDKDIKFRADLQFTQGSMISYQEAFEDYPEWLDSILGMVNKIKGEMRRQGLFMEKFFVRTAYRLYDGTYIMQSAPVLIAPSMEDNPMIWPYKIKAAIKKDTFNVYYWEITVSVKILYRAFVLGVKSVAPDSDKEILKDWEDVIDRICVFVTPQMQYYNESPSYMMLTRKEKIPQYDDTLAEVTDQTVINGEGISDLIQGITADSWRKGIYRAYLSDYGYWFGRFVSRRYSPPRLANTGGDVPDNQYQLPHGNDAGDKDSLHMVMDSQDISFDTGIDGGDFSAKLYNNQKLEVEYNLSDDALITDDTKKNYYIAMLAEFGGFNHIIRFEEKSETETEQIEQQYLFYPLKDYSIQEALKLGTSEDTDNKTMIWPNVGLNNSSTMWPRKGEQIQAPADMSFVKFPKDTLDTLTAGTDTLTDDYNSWQNIQPDFVHTYNGRLNAANIKITFRDMPCTWLGGQEGDEASVKKYKGQAVIVVNGVTACAEIDEVYYKLSVNAGYFYYPHPDAKRIEIISVPESTPYTYDVYKIELKTHPYLHGAYFFAEDFDINDYKTSYSTKEDAEAALTAASGVLQYPNYMYTSEVDNPFFFPSQGVNAIGTDRIVAVKSATKAMSEGTAFGSMPLYVFCTDGIWPLSVGSTGLFVATNPPTRETLLNNDPNAALQIDNAVVFLSERGLMQLIGERTTLLSGDLQERFSTFDVKDLPLWNSISQSFGIAAYLEADDFISYIIGARMAFDYVNYRIIVFKPYSEQDVSTHTAYIYNIASKMWATMDNRMLSSVEGYPSSIVNVAGTEGVSVSRFSQGVSSLIGGGKAFYVTRPLKLGKHDVLKTVRTLIERSVTHGGAKLIALWGSRDMVSWQLAGAVNGGKMPRLSGTPYKYFIVAGWSMLAINGDTISRLTVEEKDKYQDKLR